MHGINATLFKSNAWYKYNTRPCNLLSFHIIEQYGVIVIVLLWPSKKINSIMEWNKNYHTTLIVPLQIQIFNQIKCWWYTI